MNNQLCANCGKPIDLSARFCEGCGAQVMQQPQVQHMQPPQQPQYQPPAQYEPLPQYQQSQQPPQYEPPPQYQQQPPQSPQYPPQYEPQQYNYTPQPIEDAPGRKFLFVVGILYIVFGALGALGALVDTGNLINPSEWLWMYGGEAMLGAWNFYYIAPIFLYVFTLIVGIISVINSRNREKAKIIQGLAIACMSATVAYYAIIAVLGIFAYLGMLGAAAIIFMPLEFVLPILLIVGARKNIRNPNY